MTDSIELSHLDVASVLRILHRHTQPTPERPLFLWTLFEGVPKFYRDAFEQGVLGADRRALLDRLFFRSSLPLRSEADTWYLAELRGRLDTILKLIARNPGLRRGDIVKRIREADEGGAEQVSTYLAQLADRYRLVERRQPVFAKPTGKQGRYYLNDNFLQAWLAAIGNRVAAKDFRPVAELIQEADERLQDVEGFALEKLAAQLYQERSSKGIGDFPLSRRVEGFWDRKEVEIDLVLVSKPLKRVRFGSCKRNPKKLVADVNNFRGHVERYFAHRPLDRGWTYDLVGVAPRMDVAQRETLARHGVVGQDLNDLTRGLLPVSQGELG